MIEWREFCDGVQDVQMEGENLVVSLGRGRQHRLRVRLSDDAFELTGIVARRSIVESIEDAALKAWQRNRTTGIVGFRLDKEGRLVGGAWVPLAGLTKEEFLFYVRSTAIACDLFEFQLTGRDRE